MGRKTLGKDVHPQLLRFSVTQSATNTFTEQVVQTPNLTEAGYVMEILRIFWQQDDWGDGAAGDEVEWAIYESSRAAMPNISQSGVIMRQGNRIDFTTSGLLERMLSGSVDFTDGAGNGLLIGRKEIIAALDADSQTTGVLIMHFAILYRLVKVSPAELVGLISS